MANRVQREELIPSAARLLSSLRDLGYDFVNAVADLIDNSIAANAGRVDVTIKFDGEDSWVRIADDGDGMSTGMISEAMRLGSGTRNYGDTDLGKFGLGLKTASLSQARCITVASRIDPKRRTLDCRILDLDDVVARDRWEIIHPAAVDRPSEAVSPLKDTTGTVVVWTNLDRVLSRKDPFGGWAQRYLLNLAERLDVHLGMVFERFLTGQARRRRKLTITINGTKVEPWDPFCTKERTEYLPERELPVGGSVVKWRPYVLPPQREFSDDEAWRRASGPRQWNNQQGLYIYRADRMIQSGGWSWLRSADEHVKLARAGLEFWPVLDDAFEINISKMRVKLPDDLREQLKPLVSFLTKRADERYRISGRKDRPPTPPTPPPRTGGGGGTAYPPESLPQPGPAPTPPAGSGKPMPQPPAFPRIPEAGDALSRAAKAVGAEKALKQIREELAKTDAQVAYDLGW
jgi:hypothetical protein